jgi:hypothetical protein
VFVQESFFSSGLKNQRAHRVKRVKLHCSVLSVPSVVDYIYAFHRKVRKERKAGEFCEIYICAAMGIYICVNLRLSAVKKAEICSVLLTHRRLKFYFFYGKKALFPLR